MSNDLIKHVTDANFEEQVLKAQGPVLVDYWAEWCGPCKMIAPVLDDIATTYEGKLTIAKLNIDDNQETPAKHGLQGAVEKPVRGRMYHLSFGASSPVSRKSPAICGAFLTTLDRKSVV